MHKLRISKNILALPLPSGGGSGGRKHIFQKEKLLFKVMDDLPHLHSFGE
jgi:hypothetical protein